MFVAPKFCISIVFSFSWELKWPQEKLRTVLMQNFGVTNKEHYGICGVVNFNFGPAVAPSGNIACPSRSSDGGKWREIESGKRKPSLFFLLTFSFRLPHHLKAR